MNLKWTILSVISIICINSCFAEPKRTWSISRTRSKTSNASVRRRLPNDSASSKQIAPVQQKSSASSLSNAKPDQSIGAPPPYSASGVNAGKSNLYAAPPSYSQATGVNSPYNPNYPRQGYGFQQQSMGAPPPYSAPGVNAGYGGHGGYGGAMPNYGGGGHGGYGGAMPNYGGGGGYGGAMPNYGGGGGYGGAMPNYGGHGGYGGPMPMYQQKSSSGALTGIMGGALTGLATYQLARAIGGGFGGGHSSTQHIYHHHEHPQQPQQPQIDQQQPRIDQQQPQVPLATAEPNNNNNAPSLPVQATGDIGKENATPDNIQSITPIPDVSNEYPYPTIHPSLFPYALNAPSKDLEYWAKSHTKQLNL